MRNIRFLDQTRGEEPCKASKWRILTDNLAVCDICDDPPTTCYIKPKLAYTNNNSKQIVSAD